MTSFVQKLSEKREYDRQRDRPPRRNMAVSNEGHNANADDSLVEMVTANEVESMMIKYTVVSIITQTLFKKLLLLLLFLEKSSTNEGYP